jgi:hypothetical protein
MSLLQFWRSWFRARKSVPHEIVPDETFRGASLPVEHTYSKRSIRQNTRKRFTAKCRSLRRFGGPHKPCVRYCTLKYTLLGRERARHHAPTFHFVQSAQRFRFVQRAAADFSARPQSPVWQGFAGNQALTKITRVR